MHSRNVFKNKPDYSKLAELYPKFGEILVEKDNFSRPTIDYTDSNSLRLLSTTLLKHYFGLDVTLPTNRLIPAIPQRLNYILWVQDLVDLLNLTPNEKIIGVDIGTGASCIFPLLGCSIDKRWTFIASEADVESYEYAIKNVNNNNLHSRIEG